MVKSCFEKVELDVLPLMDCGHLGEISYKLLSGFCSPATEHVC